MVYWRLGLPDSRKFIPINFPKTLAFLLFAVTLCLQPFFVLAGNTVKTDNFKGRLLKATTTAQTSNFGYDHTNQRVSLKEGSLATTTTYANKFYSTQGATTTKHIFANGMLVATIENTESGGSSTITPDTTSTSITTGYNGGPVTKTWSHTTSGSNRGIGVSPH